MNRRNIIFGLLLVFIGCSDNRSVNVSQAAEEDVGIKNVAVGESDFEKGDISDIYLTLLSQRSIPTHPGTEVLEERTVTFAAAGPGKLREVLEARATVDARWRWTSA